MNLNAKLKTLYENALWAFRCTWATAPRLTAGVIILGIIQSFLPAIQALAGRNLVNAASDVLNHQADTQVLYLWLGVSFALALLWAIIGATNNYFNLQLYDAMNIKITNDILEHAAELDYASFENSANQDVMLRAQQNIAAHFTQFINLCLTIIGDGIQIITLGALLIYLEPLLVVLFIPLALPYAWFQIRLSQKRYTQMQTRATKARWGIYYSSKIMTAVGVAEVKLLNLARVVFLPRNKDLMQEFRRQDYALYTRNFWGNIVFVTVSIGLFYLTFIRLVSRSLQQAVTIGDIAIYAAAALRLRSAIEETVGALSGAFEHTLYVANLIAFLELQPQRKTKETTDEPVVMPGHGKIVVEDVSFTYPGSERPSLQNISFSIEPNEVVAIVGPNGAGKSTLLKLLVGFYELNQGRILLDDIDIHTLPIATLHRQFAFYFQGLSSYEASIADNIAYGDWETLHDDSEALEKFARLAGAHEMIQELPQKYDTHIGRAFGKYDLSGGQWQKIALARALARRASILMMDEPTSNLDIQAEYDLLNHFREVTRTQTTILISHRLSTVQLADRIIVLEKGRITEVGSHEELMARNGYYAGLYRSYRMLKEEA